MIFGGYGFNKATSAAYALVGYQTAYFKAHIPAEFMAAVLTSEIDDGNKARIMFVEHMEDARSGRSRCCRPMSTPARLTLAVAE